jgi:5-methylcytosine-specific restriction endonuclease McrA
MSPVSPGGLCLDCQRRALPGTRYCQAHQTDNQARQKRLLYDSFGRDEELRPLYRCKRWEVTRQRVLRRDILCVACGHRAATEVDHVLRARLVVDNFGLDEFYSVDRLKGLCHTCHSQKTAHESGWAGSKGTRIESLSDRTNTIVVCGQPASGKSTYIEEHKQQDDLVWDYDVVMQRITGLPLHQSLQGAIGSVLADRDNFIQATSMCERRVWIICANPSAYIVKLLHEAGASVVTMQTPDDECQRRLQARRKQEAQAVK